MNRVISLIALFGFAAVGCVSVKGNVSVQDNSEKSASMLRHVVLFKFKPGASDADIEKVVVAFHNLKNGIDTVRSIESGTDISPEKLSQGFTHCFIVTFDDAAGRDTYLTHPVHLDFVKLAGPVLEQALVVDFIPRK